MSVMDENSNQLIEEPIVAAIPPKAEPLPLSSSDERLWATLAHLSIYLNLVTGLLGTVVALIIYLAYKDRSKYVAYQSLQALVFQLVFLLGGGLLIGLVWAVTGLLSLILIGLLLVPFALLISMLPIGAYIYPIFAALETKDGEDFKYWLVGDWVRGTLEA